MVANCVIGSSWPRDGQCKCVLVVAVVGMFNEAEAATAAVLNRAKLQQADLLF